MRMEKVGQKKEETMLKIIKTFIAIHRVEYNEKGKDN